MLVISNAHCFLSGLEQFALLVSAIAHDVAHPGFNNKFLVDTGHELALQYNDISPLENMHCSNLFTLIGDGTNIFESLNRNAFFESRKICIEAILSTDMSKHNGMVEEAKGFYQNRPDARSQDPASFFKAKEIKTKVMNIFLHVADISNPTRPWTICREWAFKCLDEFFLQGDREKQLAIPVQPLNDRTTVNKATSQISFIEYMIVPLEAAKVKLFPSLHEPTTFLKCNLEEWFRLWIEEDAPTDVEREKFRARVAKASQTLTRAMEGSIDSARSVF